MDGWECALYCFDSEGVAGLIVTVAGAAPERLGKLLHMLWSSKERLEARVVVKLALQCQDSLAPLATLCRDALKTATDLGTLLRVEPWCQVEEVCPDAHAGALLNLCEAILASPTPHNEKRRQRIREIRPRVKRAAAAELASRRDEIERIGGMRATAVPNLWSLFAAFVARNKKRG